MHAMGVLAPAAQVGAGVPGGDGSMDLASIIGILIGVGCLGYVGFEASHGHWSMFYSQEGVFMVFGGSISVVFMSMPLSKLKCVGGFLRAFLFHSAQSPIEIIRLLSTLADKARREGLLALEADMGRVVKTDRFLASGLKMLIDGATADTLQATLRLEITAMQERHKAGKKFFDLIKLYGPGWGLVGTLVGQIGMFGNLGSGDAGSMGKMLAVAVTATMYGTILANAIAGPIGDKLALRSSEEILNREMVLQGLCSIQEGDNPRITMDKMLAFIPAAHRAQATKAAA